MVEVLTVQKYQIKTHPLTIILPLQQDRHGFHEY